MKDWMAVRRLLNDALHSKRVLVAVHRGCRCGNFVENTLKGLKAVWRMGGDIAELDVSASSDGVLYAFHDDMERYLLEKDVNIRELPSHEVDRMIYRNSNDVPTEPVNRLEYVLCGLKGRGLINIDRAWFHWEKTLSLLDRFGMADQAIIKTPVSEEYLAYLERCETPFMYMPIMNTADELETVRRYSVNTVGYELLFEKEDHQFLEPEFQSELKKDSSFLWCNAITLGNCMLAAGHDDDGAITGDPEAHWGWIADHGFNVIQTDWPMLLSHFLVRRSA